jgi:hypothetical protein
MGEKLTNIRQVTRVPKVPVAPRAVLSGYKACGANEEVVRFFAPVPMFVEKFVVDVSKDCTLFASASTPKGLVERTIEVKAGQNELEVPGLGAGDKVVLSVKGNTDFAVEVWYGIVYRVVLDANN